MPLPIQRVPRGVSELLTIFGGRTPTQLEDSARAVIDLLQFYGQSQLQTASVSNAALAEGGNVDITVPANEWWLLFSAHYVLLKTGTLTAFFGQIALGLNGTFGAILGAPLTTFGATETGIVSMPVVLPYPRILQPRSVIRGTPTIVGTDATVNFGITTMHGVLG